MLIGAMPTVLTTSPQAHLVLAGGGRDETMLRDLVTSLGLEDNVSLLTDDALRERLSGAGLQRVRELFDIRVTAQRTADVHAAVLAAR